MVALRSAVGRRTGRRGRTAGGWRSGEITELASPLASTDRRNWKWGFRPVHGAYDFQSTTRDEGLPTRAHLALPTPHEIPQERESSPRLADLPLRSAVEKPTQTAISPSQITRRTHGWNPPTGAPVTRGAYPTHPVSGRDPRAVNQSPRTYRAKPSPMTTMIDCERLSDRSCTIRFCQMTVDLFRASDLDGRMCRPAEWESRTFDSSNIQRGLRHQ